MLELKSLLIGLAFAVGVFAMKTGAGLSYFLTRQRTTWQKIGVLFVIGASYFLLFLLSWYVCTRVDVVLYFNELRTLFQSGMTLHVVVAVGVFIWGFSLLRTRPKHGGHGSWGWLSLVIPCPVCGSVIFFTTGFLASLYPDDSLSAVLGAYALFAAIMLVTLSALTVVSRLALWSPEHILAFSMLFIASYFILSVLVVPHFSDLDKVYRVAAFHSSQGSVDAKQLACVLLLAVIAISAGFLLQRMKQRNVR